MARTLKESKHQERNNLCRFSRVIKRLRISESKALEDLLSEGYKPTNRLRARAQGALK